MSEFNESKNLSSQPNLANEEKIKKLVEQGGYSYEQLLLNIVMYMEPNHLDNAIKMGVCYSGEKWPMILDEEGNLIPNPSTEK